MGKELIQHLFIWDPFVSSATCFVFSCRVIVSFLNATSSELPKHPKEYIQLKVTQADTPECLWYF